jgi:hypothetical protein
VHQKWARERAKKTGLSDPSTPFIHQGSADLNSYKLFRRAGVRAVEAGGQLGVITPSGLYTDKGAVDCAALLERCAWRWLYGFENRNKVFDIHRSFKFAITIAQKGGTTEALHAAFMRHELDDWAEARRGARVSGRAHPGAFSPKSLSVLEIRSGRDLEVLTKIYANSVLLGDDGPDGWGSSTRPSST